MGFKLSSIKEKILALYFKTIQFKGMHAFSSNKGVMN